jgi:trehalose utilization protein
MAEPIRVTVWNEFKHEKDNETCRRLYPEGMHAVIAAALEKEADIATRTGTLDDPEQGLSQEVVDATDVFVWWGHRAHGEVLDEVVDRVQQRVLDGAGFIGLHSAHFSKIFKRLMGTTCKLRWRVADERERLWNVAPQHPITQGVGDYIELPHVEMYGERFDIPEPDQQIFISWFEGGEVFRSGCCYRRGNGNIFYFRPGHETYPIFHDETIQRVIANAVRWCRPVIMEPVQVVNMKEPLEKIGE